jgi:CRISPR/Cas system-associated exonuclease Cas4 (RecB family)
MGHAILLPPSVSLTDEIVPLLKGEDRDYSSAIVVFPGRRPSHFLRRVIARKLNESFIPPRIFSMDDFIDHLYEETLGIGRGKIDSIDAIALLYEIHRKSSSPLGGDAYLSAETFLPLGAQIISDIEELCIESVSPQKVKGIDHLTEDRIPLQALEKLQSLSSLYEAYYKELDERGLSSRSLRYRTISENIESVGLRETGQIIFAGFFALTETEKSLFRGLHRRDNTIYLFHEAEGIDLRLKEIGITPDIPYPDLPAGRSHVDGYTFYRSPDTHGQVLTLSSLLRDALSSSGKKSSDDHIPLNETAIILPSAETLFPLLHNCLCLLDENQYNITLGYPLYRTPIFGFFNCLIESVTSMDGDQLYIPDYLKFVLHPYTKNLYFSSQDTGYGDHQRKRSDITRIIFHMIEEEFQDNRKESLITLKEIESDEELMHKISASLHNSGITVNEDEVRRHLRDIHVNTIESFSSFENTGDFAGKAMKILTYIYENSTARLHPFFHPFAETFLNSLRSIARSQFSETRFERLSGYFQFFRRYISRCTTPFEGTPLRGLQVLGPLETRSLQFKRIFFLDLNEGVIPDTKIEDSLLPFKAREILALPTYRNRERLMSYYFDILLKGAEEVHLFHVENDRKERSRFIERLLWERQKSETDRRKADTGSLEDYLQGRELIQSIQYTIKLDNVRPKEVKKTEEVIKLLREFTFTATSLDAYLQCPLRFYYSHMLGLKRKEAGAGETERHEIGNLVHKILSLYFGSRKNRPLTADMLKVSDMKNVVDSYFERTYGRKLRGRLYLTRSQVKNHLVDFLEHYYKPLIRQRPIVIEKTEHRISLSLRAYNLAGIIDSVETRDGKVFIIDYKTSSSDTFLKINFMNLAFEKRHSWPEHIGSLQLPFYLLLYRGNYQIEIEKLEGLYLLLGKSRISNDIELSLFDAQEERKRRFDLLRNIVFSLLDEIVDPELPFTPTSNTRDNCPYCQFQDICGTQWIRKTRRNGF